MNTNKTLKSFLIALLVAICGAIVSFFTSCASARYDHTSTGRTSIYTTDTTYIQHGGNISIKIK